jgi:hypothetical protein
MRCVVFLHVLGDVVVRRLLGLLVQCAMAFHGDLLVYKGARRRVEDGIRGLRIDWASLCWLQE